MKPPGPRTSTASRFRSQIEKAEADGASRADMTLQLTRSDVSDLKRDPKVPVTDISFAGGVMTFLGVKIVQGGVATSVLDCGEGG
jgi:hypothetical protein